MLTALAGILSVAFTLSAPLSLIVGLYAGFRHKEWAVFRMLGIAYLVTLALFLLGEFSFPSEPSEPPVSAPVELTTERSDVIRLETPRTGETVRSPLTIRGEAHGTWFFEASFPVTIVDWDGRIIGEGIARATGDWMTEEFVPFEATLTFAADPEAYSGRGAIILKKDNPSGLPANDDSVEIPVTLASAP